MEKLRDYKTFKNVQDLSKNVNRFISNHHLTKSALKILRLIEWYSRKNPGACWLKVKTICDKVGVSDSTVRRSIKKLKDLSVISVVPTTRKNTGGDGANIYVINHYDNAGDSAEMTDRRVDETLDKSTVEGAFPETEYVSSKEVIKKEKEYEEREEFDHTYVRDFVPNDFTSVVKRYYNNAIKIETLWKKVILCIKHYAPKLTGYEDESVDIAISAFKQSILSDKQGSIRGSFGGYFYGVLTSKLVALQRKLVMDRIGVIRHAYF